MPITKIPLNQRRVEPDICAVLEQLADQIKVEINCMTIGTIVSFSASDQTASISINYRRVDLNSGVTTDYPILIKCPVVTLNGGGGYITFPVVAGDTCLVFFCDREIDTWFTNGGVNAPQSARIHDLNDGIALVGIRNSLGPIASYPTDRSRWAHGGGHVDMKGGDLFTAEWTDYFATSTKIGWVTPVGYIYTKKIGKTVFVNFELSGVSDSVITTFTVPFTSVMNFQSPCYANAAGSEAVGRILIYGGTSLVSLGKDIAGNAFSNTGIKNIDGQFWYEASS
jgi:hypothetical protein